MNPATRIHRFLRSILFVATTTALAALAVAPPIAAAADAFDHDHAAFDRLLDTYVSDGVVDYAGWKAAGRADLDAYLASLESVTRQAYTTFSEPQKLAYWINVYNAYMIQMVLDHHPIEGVKDLGSLINPYAVFKKEFIPLGALVGEEKLSLDHVEHEILRKEFAEPRIHVGVVCASKSCPVLQPDVFRASNLEEQLSAAMRGFLADDFRNRVDVGEKTLYLSKIFDWFAEDFEKHSGSVAAYVAEWAPAPMAAVARDPEVEVEHLDYDWSLNGK